MNLFAGVFLSIQSTALVDLLFISLGSLFGDVGETDPTFSVLDVVELHHDLLLRMTISLDGLPEVDELVLVNLAIRISVDLVEKFLR